MRSLQKPWMATALAMVVAVLGAGLARGAPASRPVVAASQPAVADRIATETRRILASAKTTLYSHKTTIDEPSGIYAFDCSGMICVILAKVAPAQLAAVPVPKGEKRQRAVDFYESFAAAPTGDQPLGGWRQIPRLLDARPGDLLAWRKATIEPGQNTGHIIVIDEPPVDEGKGIVRVTIIDSTSINHHADTRKAGESGVGRGTMWFQTDEQGRPTGYQWSGRATKFTRVPIAVGRAVEMRP